MIRGDILFNLELNKIHHIDCIEGMKLIPDKSINLILTDIPYGEVSKMVQNEQNIKGSLEK
jgi:DNA modification methylase